MIEPLAKYVFFYYSQFMTEQEKLAFRHLGTTMKATGGQSDLDAQQTVRLDRIRSKWMSDDPEVLRLAADGYDAFITRTAERILRDSRAQIFLNHCPKCGELARTPVAKQCRFCGYDWHETTPLMR
ncbi:MAG: hypothetical protein ACM3JB_07700 [Acidobacteriaceae bacterium]